MRFWLAITIAATLSAFAGGASAQQTQTAACDIPGEAWFSEQERWAWAQICAGDEADLSLRKLITGAGGIGACDPFSNTPYPADQIISSRFLRLILTERSYERAAAPGLARLRCARFVEPLDLNFVELNAPVLLDGAVLEGGVSMIEMRSEAGFAVLGSRIDGDFIAEGVALGGPFSLSRGGDSASLISGSLTLARARIEGAVEAAAVQIGGLADAYQAKIEGPAQFSGASIGGPARFDSAQIEGDLAFAGGLVSGQATFRDAAIAESVDFVGAVFAQGFDLGRARIGRSAFLRRTSAIGQANMRASEITSNFEAIEAIFNGALFLDRASVGGELILRDATLRGDAVLGSAQIGAGLVIEGGEISGGLDADGVQIDGPAYVRAGVKVNGPVKMIGARIGDDLQLAGGEFNELVDLTSARIDGELTLSHAIHGDAIWGEDARLTLRNTQTSALQARMEAWTVAPGAQSAASLSGEYAADTPIHLSTDLTGLTYERLGGFHADKMRTMVDATADELIRWIGNQTEADGAPHSAKYDPQPYRQLASVLETEGRLDKARAVRFAQFEHYRTADDTPKLRAWGMMALRWLTGYGEYPIRALWWYLGLVGAGFIVSYFGRGFAGFSLGRRFWYSLDHSLPVLELSEQHKEIDHGVHWVSGLFHLQRLLGVVLATSLVGAISLL